MARLGFALASSIIGIGVLCTSHPFIFLLLAQVGFLHLFFLGGFWILWVGWVCSSSSSSLGFHGWRRGILSCVVFAMAGRDRVFCMGLFCDGCGRVLDFSLFPCSDFLHGSFLRLVYAVLPVGVCHSALVCARVKQRAIKWRNACVHSFEFTIHRASRQIN